MSSPRSLSSDEEDAVNPCIEPRQVNQNITKKPMTPGRAKIHSWLDKYVKVTMTDSRILVGDFLCTDRDANIILGLTYEYTSEESEGRYLGSVMVPGKHIVKLEVDMSPSAGARSGGSQQRQETHEETLENEGQQEIINEVSETIPESVPKNLT